MIVRGLRSCAIVAIGAVVLVTVTTGCSGPKVATKSSAELALYKVRSIVLLPFTAIATPQARDQGEFFFSTPSSIRRSDISISVPSTLDPPPHQTMTVPGYATEQVTELFWGRLRDRKGLLLLSPSDATRVSSADEELANMPPEKAAAAIAKRLKADAALIGLVSVYQERVGSRLGADPPATVGFEAKVVAADGQVLWVGSYYERQRPMTEDLKGFLRRWAFVTAGELAEYGVEEVLRDFPFGEGEEK